MQMNYYQDCALVTAIYPEEFGLGYTALGLAGEAGEVANKIKKIYRDDEGVLTEERRQQIKQELGGVVWYLAALAKECGLSLDEIADYNIKELRSRMNRGVLKGSGDNR